MRLRRPHTKFGWAAWSVGAVVCAAVFVVLVAPYNIAARIPHPPGVGWLLHTYMRNAVRTWSLGTTPPDWFDVEDPALIRLGAAHFEAGCAPCHGAPGRAPNPVTRGMRPAPPPLDRRLDAYDTEELYWIVWNGLKYTGMPAWAGAERDDEPWAVAAFLRTYPELDPDAYAQLAFGEATQQELNPGRSVSFSGLHNRLETLTANCARCHGADGMGRDGTAPKIAGQSRVFLQATLTAFAEGDRASGIMAPIAAALSPAEIADLARHYSELPGFDGTPPGTAKKELVHAGAALAARGSTRSPSCLSCHRGDQTPPRNPIYPRILGQEERFLLIWLRLWRAQAFGGTPYAEVMHEVASGLSDDDIKALAAFFGSGGATFEDESQQ